jgi:ribonuclease-3
MGKGEEKSGGREKDSILASSLEALAGAVFVDSSSYEETKRVLKIIFCEVGNIDFLISQ